MVPTTPAAGVIPGGVPAFTISIPTRGYSVRRPQACTEAMPKEVCKCKPAGESAGTSGSSGTSSLLSRRTLLDEKTNSELLIAQALLILMLRVLDEI
jgi:hypothetical protein